MKISDITKAEGFVRLIELFPPGVPAPDLLKEGQQFDLALRFEKLVESIGALEAIADGFSLPELKDSERIHLNSVALASELKRRTGSAIVPTLTLRDANRQSLLGTVAFAIYSGIENILLVRGDPYQSSNANEPKNVYDLNSISAAVSSIRRLESHLVNRERLCILAPINLQKMGNDDYLEVIRGREFAGVDLFLAESLFENIDTYLERITMARKAGIRLPIIHTIFPFRGYEDALLCSRKFGWAISDDELSTLKERGREYGIELARERYHGLVSQKGIAQGACISTRGDSELAKLIAT